MVGDISSDDDSKQVIIGTDGDTSAYIYMYLVNMYMYSFK